MQEKKTFGNYTIRFGNYTIRDRREVQGQQPDPCRVCGAPQKHSDRYNNPTMECIKYLRQQLAEARKDK